MSAAAEDTNQNYYEGSSEVATETPVTLKKLETRRQLTKNSGRLVIALVGLPARGKSFVARKLECYLNWSGCKCKIFNVGKYRREAYASLQTEQQQSGAAASAVGKTTARVQTGACDANFFDAKNAKASELREKVAEVALLDMLKWLDEEGEYAPNFNSNNFNDSDGDLNSIANASSGSGGTGTGGGGGTGSPPSASSTAPRLDFHRYERVAIFDATNSTHRRRQWILEQCTRPDRPTGVVFVESVCDDQELLEENYRYKVSNSPDFGDMSPDEALRDLRVRVQKYEEQYETIVEDSLSYIKVFNLSTKLLVNHIYGRMAKELVPALMSWHIGNRPVFLCRPGQTISGIFTDGEDYVARSKINEKDPRFLDMSTKTRRKNFRGDSLGRSGKSFREELMGYCYDEAHSFLFERASVRDMAYTGTSITGLAESDAIVTSNNESERHDPFPLRILTSTMPRAIDTVNWQEFKFRINAMSNLNPLDKGDFAGMELEEIRKINPAWFEKLVQDPFDTRFPGGESYRDLIRRVTSVVIDVEQQIMPTLVVSHVSILQCLMAYFRNTPVERCMSIEVPLHTVVKYTPVRGGGWKETMVRLCDVEGMASNELLGTPTANDSPAVKKAVHTSATAMNNTTASKHNNSNIRSVGARSGSSAAMLNVESSSEISALSMTECAEAAAAAAAAASPIWGDHVLAAAKKAMVKGTG